MSERNDIGVMIRAGSRLWVMRASDLVHHPRGHTYFRIFGDWEHSHPVYGTLTPQYGSVWRYQSTAENYINRNGIVADLFWTEIKPTGKITSDGRKHLVPATDADDDITVYGLGEVRFADLAYHQNATEDYTVQAR